MCDKCDWLEYVNKIEDLLEEDVNDSSEFILDSISDWASKNKHITEKQKMVIDNIERELND